MATSGHPKILLNNVTANGAGTRQHCAVNFGQGEVPQACANFYVDVTVTGAPTAYTVTITGGIDEQGTGATIGTITTSPGLHTFANFATPVTWWQATLSGLTGGTSPTVRAVGVSAS